VALGAVACVGAAVFAGWWWRGEVAAPATAAPTSAGPAVRGEVAAAEVPSPVAGPTEIAPDRARGAEGAASVRARVRRAASSRGDVKDPYGDARDLKPDPFR
jgi:hypothetical protein